MNWLVYHIASGHAFFSGVALIIVAALVSARSMSIARRVAVLAFLLGVIAIVISSTAIPVWGYAVAVVVTMLWLVSAYLEKWRRWTRIAVVAGWAVAAAIELPYHITPSLVSASSRSMTVIGDSVTAGMGASDQSVRWPALLAEEHNLRVQDISHPGETAGSALKRARSQQLVSSVVFLEIGGNDLLGDTTSADFSRDLDALLAYASAPGRQVIMLELPLPPFRNEYGRIQRSLARQHNVALVPKRVFLSVLAAKDSTVDTIHLTQAGHRLMAATVWNLVEKAFPATKN
jgi:acyl-CoA thioesterase-1